MMIPICLQSKKVLAPKSRTASIARLWNKRIIKEKFVDEEIKMSWKVAKKSKYRSTAEERKIEEKCSFFHWKFESQFIETTFSLEFITSYNFLLSFSLDELTNTKLFYVVLLHWWLEILKSKAEEKESKNVCGGDTIVSEVTVKIERG